MRGYKLYLLSGKASDLPDRIRRKISKKTQRKKKRLSENYATQSLDVRVQLTSPDTSYNLSETCKEDFISTAQLEKTTAALDNHHNSWDELIDQHDETKSSTDTESEFASNGSRINKSSEINEDGVILLSSQATLYNELFLQELQDKEDFSTRKNNITQPKDLKSMVESDDFFKTISSVATKSPAEVLYMALKFALKNKLPISVLSNLLKIINTIFNNQVICESKYFIDKILSSGSSRVEFYGICPKCKINIGKIENFESYIICQICSEKIETSHPSCANLFMYIDPSDKIKSSIEQNQDYYLHVMHNRERDKIIRHIYDGKAYKKLVKSLNDKYKYVTAILNTDGAPRFESSTYSIWPIYLKLNEIPLDCTGKNVITIGLWFGKNKPDMTAFLEPVVENLNSLSENGIECCIKNSVYAIKLYIIVACVDAVARAPMQGFMQYNAEYGCGWCLQAGKHYAKSIRYLYLTPPAELRTREGTIAHAATLVENGMKKSVYGVKNVSPFMLLNKFDLIIGFVPDYLHCALSGVGKRITECILRDLSADQLKKINSLLLDIKVPHQLARLTRSLDDRAQWKAREWENFILYYSLPVFSLVLNSSKFYYWSLFVNALYILLQHEITYEQLDEADAMLHEFLRLTKDEYGKENMTYNIHQLLHLAPSVENWGPLFAHSTFPFEAANHDLLQAIHCANGVNLQISRFLNMQNVVCQLEKCLSERSSIAKVNIFFKKFSSCESIDNVKIDNIVYLGRSFIMSPNMCYNFQMPVTSLLYSRAVKDGCLYTTSMNRNKRSNNSYAQLINGQFIEIFHFAVDEVNKKGIVIYKTVVVGNKLSKHIYEVSKIENSLLKADTSEIKIICVFISSTHLSDKKFIIALPNLYDY